MTKNLILMLVILVVGLLAVWSWFTVNKEVQSNGMFVQARYPNEVSLAPVVEYYNNDGSFNHEGPGVFSGQLSFPIDPDEKYIFTKDCTGDGDTLLVPDFSVLKDKDKATKEGRLVNVNGAWEEALSNIDIKKIKQNNPETELEARYMEFPFYVRSSTKSFSVTSMSCVKSDTESNNGRLSDSISDTSNPKKSSYGNFNSDALVGAIRVAFLTQAVTDVQQSFNSGSVTATTATLQTSANSQTVGRELTMLWVPRPDIHLDVSNTGRTDDWGITTGVLPNTTLLHEAENRCYTHDFYLPTSTSATPESYAAKGTVGNNPIEKKKGTGVTLKGENDLGTNGSAFLVTNKDGVTQTGYPILGDEFDVSNSLSYRDYVNAVNIVRDSSIPDSDTNRDNYYVYRITMRVWIEGTDSEARRAMDGGGFNIHLEMK